jgi:BirA family biotin operon repressor/biotin-[acetyl-CoA-carboxylase] ligase
MQLSETAVAAGFSHSHQLSVGSTNSDLIELAQTTNADKVWLTADEQTQGKGSRGRSWTSKTGNMYGSLLLREPAPLRNLHQLTFVAALACHGAIDEVTGNSGAVKIKWPNDVLLNQKKCGGILLESSTANNETFVVIGMGLNCSVFPDHGNYAATSLQNEGFEVSQSQLFAVLSSKMVEFLILWDRGNEFSAIRKHWLDNAFGVDQQIEVKIPTQETKTGRFVSVDEDGFMLLEVSGGAIERISTADIFFV